SGPRFSTSAIARASASLSPARTPAASASRVHSRRPAMRAMLVTQLQGSCLDVENAVSVDRLRESLERVRSGRLGLDEVLDLREDALARQDLPGHSLVAEPRGEVHDAPHGSVVETPVEADLAEGRV